LILLILVHIWQVDQFEAEAKALEEKVRAARVVEEQNKKEQRRLIEVVTQAQIEMDGIKVSPESALLLLSVLLHSSPMRKVL
jgi:hypothetical protein